MDDAFNATIKSLHFQYNLVINDKIAIDRRIINTVETTILPIRPILANINRIMDVINEENKLINNALP